MQVNKFEVIGEAYKVKTFGTTQWTNLSANNKYATVWYL